jgi:glycosyltransferase involved in cell wall biosynthesis
VIVTLLIPVFNEVATFAELIERIDALDLEVQLVVVDDGSTDGTGDLIDALLGDRDDAVIVHQSNRGKGAALAAAIPHATGDVVVVQDADLEYDPAEIPQLIEPIVAGAADVVFGSRLSGGRPQRAYLFWHLVGNRFLSLVANVLYNTTITDIETGYKAFRREVIQALDLREKRFGVEPEITAKVCKAKLRIYELPIAYYGRSYDEGKKITWRDGFRALWVLVRERVSPNRIQITARPEQVRR